MGQPNKSTRNQNSTIETKQNNKHCWVWVSRMRSFLNRHLKSNQQMANSTDNTLTVENNKTICANSHFSAVGSCSCHNICTAVQLICNLVYSDLDASTLSHSNPFIRLSSINVLTRRAIETTIWLNSPLVISTSRNHQILEYIVECNILHQTRFKKNTVTS